MPEAPAYLSIVLLSIIVLACQDGPSATPPAGARPRRRPGVRARSDLAVPGIASAVVP